MKLSEEVTVIRPSKGWRMLDFKELWSYRELLWVLAMRDVAEWEGPCYDRIPYKS